MNLVAGARRRAVAVFLLIGVLAAGGLYLAQGLPSAIFPSVTFPVVKVIADAGEEPAARMIPTITRPLEEAVHRVPGVENVLSTTSRGSTEIRVEFSWGTDMAVALQRVQGEVARIGPDLPSGTRTDVEWMNTAIFPILGYALTSETKSQADLWDLAEYTLKPELIRIPGVSQVQVQGGRQREFQVHLDRQALDGRRLTAADVVAAIRRNNQILSAGLIERNHELYLSLVDGRARGIETLSRISVPVPGGGLPARLSELGSIAAADAVSYVRTTANGRPAVLVNVVRAPSGNTVRIGRAVDELLRRHPELLPRGVRWEAFYDQAEFITHSVHGVRDAILIGVLLAIAVLWLFLRDLRAAVIAVSVIPISVAIVLLVLAASGQTVNLMTMGGIAAAIGLVVDDAIVVVENIHQHGARGAADPVESGTRELLPALTGSSLSTVVVFLPFALLGGVAGAFFRPLALTIATSLVVSYLLAAFAVPAAVAFSERRRAARAAGPGTGRPARFERAVRGVVSRPLIAAAAAAAILAAGLLLYRAIGTDFLPEMDEGSIILDYWTPPGTSLSDTNRMLDEAERAILSLPDVATYSRRTGTQLGFFITEPNTGDYVIKLKPRGDRRPVEEVIDDLRSRLRKLEPAIRTDFGQLLEDDIGDLSGGTPQPIDVKIFGEDQEALQARARETARIVRSVAGVEDVFDGIVIAGPALDIRARPAELARYGMTTQDLHEAVEPALTGTVSGDLRLGERMYGIRVFTPAPESLAELPVRIPSGALLSLSHLAEVSTGPPEAEIDRENLKTYVGVTARLSGRSLGEAVSEIRRKLDAGVALPSGMWRRFGGLYEQQQSSFKGLLVVLLGGLLLVSVVVLFEFGDWRAPLLVAGMAVLVLTGVFGALLLTGMTFNISSFVGAIFMVGIVGEKSIFLIAGARRELRAGRSPKEAWAAAARGRLRPVLETILATGFALAPLALALGEGSQLLQPLAIGVIGGFVLSGLLVLFVLPSLYRWLDPKGKLAGWADGSG
jgi:CzcA family heavy metal efflux pump